MTAELLHISGLEGLAWLSFVVEGFVTYVDE